MSGARLLEGTPRGVLLATTMLTITAGPLHADVDMSRLPDSWFATPPRPAAVETAEKGDMTYEGFFTRKDDNATLTYLTRKPTWSYDQSSYRGAMAGLIRGFAESAEKRKDPPPPKNEVIHPDGLELVCQERKVGEYNVTILSQLTSVKLEQLLVAYHPSEREAVVAMAIGMFTPVPAPPPSKSTTAFDRAYEDTKPLAEFVYYLVVAVAVVTLAIFLIVRARRQRRAKQPPPLP